MFLGGQKGLLLWSFPNKPTQKVVWLFLWSALSVCASGVNLTPYECVRACSHTCDQKINSRKMPNTNCKQAQPSGKATQVCVCALPFASLCVFAIFIQRGVCPPFPPSACAFVSFLPSLFFWSLCDNLVLISWRMISPASSRPLFPPSAKPPAENLDSCCPLFFCTPEIAEYTCEMQDILVLNRTRLTSKKEKFSCRGPKWFISEFKVVFIARDNQSFVLS